MRRWTSVVLMGCLTGIGLCGCATGSSTADDGGQTDTVGSPPADEEPVDGTIGRDVSPEEIADSTGRSAERSAESTSAEASSGGEARPADNQQRHVVRREALLALFERGPGWLLQEVTLEPVRRDDTFKGYRIAGASERAVDRMEPQLQVGDVVEKVNGVALERPDDYLEAWSKLPRLREVSVSFRRDGETRRASWVVVEGNQDG